MRHNKKSTTKFRKKMGNDEPNNLPISLQAKLGSICVHVEEMLGPTGHEFDRAAIEQLLGDPEVVDFLEKMSDLGLLPVKR